MSTEETKAAGITRRVRMGKTQKDKKSGAHNRRMANQEARAAWSNGVEKDFPTHTCNGHKYRKQRAKASRKGKK